jgi:predicted permease
MKKILILLLCLPMIGLASFPIIKNCERTIMPVAYDVHHNTNIENSKVEIINSPIEKGGFLKFLKWLLIISVSIFLLLAIVIILALALGDIN